jgi:hypothetical protein
MDPFDKIRRVGVIVIYIIIILIIAPDIIL